jgi:hypothetical protein
MRKLALVLHLTASIGWIGAVGAFLALAIAAVSGGESSVAKAACVSMGFLISRVIVPLAFAGLLSGILSSLVSSWGLFRHYWVVIKLLLTLAAIGVLLAQVGPIEQLATGVAQASRLRPLIHAAGGLLVLLAIQVLGVYKPRGLTRYGWRKQQEQRVTSATET